MITRRAFLRIGATAAGALVAELGWPTGPRAASGSTFGAWLTLDPGGWALIRVPVPEIGQGVRTALAAILADEVGLDFSEVRVEQAPANETYGPMAAAGSDSMGDYYDLLRQAGAEIRRRLTVVGARRLGAEPDRVTIRASRAFAGSGDGLSVYTLAAEAAALEAAGAATPRADHPLLGRPLPNVEAGALVDGSARFGLDQRLPNLCYAVIERCPVLGGELESFDDREARAVPGVGKVLALPAARIPGEGYASTRGGVAVVAETTWAALTARRKLKITWDEGNNATESSDAISQRLRQAIDAPPDEIVRRHGGPAAALAAAERRIEAVYELPLLAHACMEPMNFTAWVRADSAELYGPVQVPRSVQRLAAGVLGLEPERVKVLASRAGGGYGRRLAYDYAVEALQLAKRLERPVQVVWSREDDLAHEYLRAPSAHRVAAGIDKSGNVIAWRHHLATSSLRTHIAGGDAELKPLYDTQGAFELPFQVPHLECGYSHRPVGVQCGSWRSVAHSSNAFVVNAFIDELAGALGTDALALHRRLFAGKEPVTVALPFPGRRGSEVTDPARYARVCDAVAQASGWPGGNRALGFAACRFKQTYCATVAEARMRAGKPYVHRITTAIDCGRVINPAGVRAQVEGAAMDGWATVFQWGYRLERGRATQTNFDRWPMPRIGDAPQIRTVLVGSGDQPSGAGEPPYPAVAPAIVNAIARLTGERHRKLPLAR